MRSTRKWWKLMLALVLIAGMLPFQLTGSASAAGTSAHVTKISAGGDHSLALKSDGTVWAWGLNDEGQLGDGTEESQQASPVQVLEAGKAMTGVKDIAAGYAHSLALKKDGTVWEWGTLVDADEPSDPVQVAGLNEVVSIYAGRDHSLAIRNDGTVWAWGENYAGQLGSGSYNSSPEPVQVVTVDGEQLKDVIAVAAGGAHSLALKKDGAIWAWGLNVDGQLGDGTLQTRNEAGQISDPSEVFTGIAAGENHSLAIKEGVVWAWGSNGLGQVGDGSNVSRNIPVKVTEDGEIFTAVSAGGLHSLAVKSDGTVWSWGLNALGQLGDKTYESRLIPVQALNLSNTAMVSAGQHFSLALMKDGTVWSWGTDGDGQLGAGRIYVNTTAVQTSVTDAVYATAGGTGTNPYSLVVKRDGTVSAWGWNNVGQLGDGTIENHETPVPVNIQDVQNISAGASHSLALKRDGTIWAWGNGINGELGNGTNSTSWEPVQTTVTQAVYTAVSAGGNHSLALSMDGTVWAWGANDQGQLGNGTTEDQNVPGQVSNLSDIIAISATQNYSLALKRDGTVWLWGSMILGGTELIPVQLPDPSDPSGYLSDVIAIDAGQLHSVAVKRDGTVIGWGILDYSMSYQFQEVTQTSGQAAVSAGFGYSLLNNQDRIRSWGANFYGTLGNGHVSEDPDNPFEPMGYVITRDGEYLSDVAELSAGISHVLAVKEDGTVWTWGGSGLTMLVNEPVRSPYFAAAGPDPSNPGTEEPGTTNPGTSNPGTGGSGSSSSAPAVSTPKAAEFTLKAGSAGEFKIDDEVRITIPAGTTEEDLRLTVQKLTNTTGIVDNPSSLLSGVYEFLKNTKGKFSKPITLSFRFNLKGLQEGQRASVFYYDEVAKHWVEVGGTVEGDIISAKVDHFTKFAVFAVNEESKGESTIVLKDISGHWAEDRIREAVQSGIVNGFPDGTFKPNSPVTRAEFTVMLMNALKLDGEGAILDYKGEAAIGAWARKAVAQAAAAGIIHGYSDGSFHPNDHITRAQMAVMIAGALDDGSHNFDTPVADVNAASDSGVLSLADTKEIPAWASEAVKTVLGQGIMTGRGEGKFVPKDSATRAEAVTVILKLLHLNAL